MITISIVVPVYNVEEYLKRCIDSIINQTYKNLEIILVDDGSTDRCPEMCDSYSEMDNRVQVIHKKNGGLVSARKVGTAAATGDYILNVDGDDWIEKDRVEVLVTEGIMSEKSDMVYLSGYRKDYKNSTILINSDIPQKTFYGDEIPQKVFPLLRDINEPFGAKVYCMLCTWAVKRELLQAKQVLIDNRITIAEDIICIWFCLFSARSVTFINQDGYHYIQRNSSMVCKAATASDNNYLQIKIWYHQLKKYLDTNHVSEEIRKIFICETIRSVMMADYDLLLKKNSQYLFPFTKVNAEHKIVVYGAGRMGHSLMRYLLKVKGYQVVLWVDQNKKTDVLLEYKVHPVEDIVRVNYDYIIIAVMNADLVKDIRRSLLMKGVNDNKIAIMDASVMTEDALPDEIKSDMGGVYV